MMKEEDEIFNQGGLTEQLSKTRRNYEHICEISFIQQGQENPVEGSIH